MEFLLGLGGLALLLVYLALALRAPGGATDRAGRVAFLVCHGAIIGLVQADWCYGDTAVTALDLAADGHPLPLLPAVLSLGQLALLTAYGWEAVWTVFTLSGLELALFAPVLFVAEQLMDQSGRLFSFLAPAPVASMALAAVAPFLVAPAVTQRIPSAGTRLWRVAFQQRHALLEGIAALAEGERWAYRGPRSILEAGSTFGQQRGRAVAVTTRPSLLPFRYAVEVFVALDAPWRGEGLPAVQHVAGAAWGRGELSADGAGLRLRFASATAIPLGHAELRAAVAGLMALAEGVAAPAG